MQYQIQANSRRCAATGRALEPGERFYSVLLEEDGRLVRHDYARDAWAGPPEGAFGFWSGRVPAEGTRRLAVDEDTLLDCFTRMEREADPRRLAFRYVLALLLMRRKRLRFEEARPADGGEVMTLRCARTGVRHEVVNPGLGADELAEVQGEVFQALGWD